MQVIVGEIFDVAVDIRYGSPTFGQWIGVKLSDQNKRQAFILKGFAHGLQTLEENTELLYLHTESYSPEHEGGVHYNDPKIEIAWPLEMTEISEKDKTYPLLTEAFKGIQL